jgi:histone H3
MPHSQKDEEIKEHEIEVGIPAIPSVAGKKERKKRRTRPGIGALRQIRKLQKGVELMIPKAPFRRLVRDIVGDAAQDTDMRIGKDAFAAMQEAAEIFIEELFKKSNDIAMANRRKGPMPNDMRIVLKHDTRNDRLAIQYDTKMVPSKRRRGKKNKV